MTKKLTSPLDELFETETTGMDVDNYAQVTEKDMVPTDVVPVVEKDEEDVQIDEKIDTVYTEAIDTFRQQMQYAEIVEPRYAARNAEVAASYLNIALSAAGMRAKVKTDRKKTNAFVPYAGKNPNGAVVASLDDIMKIIAVDAETKVVK
jgi:hypothetical protein